MIGFVLCSSACRSQEVSPATDKATLSGVFKPGKQEADPNWITISPTDRYLMFEDGSPFVPVGVAMGGDLINFDYFGRTRVGGKSFKFSDDHFDDLFKSMQKHGENFLRIDIEGTTLMPREDIERLISEGKIQFLEDPVGVFNETYAQRIDRLIALAEKYDIYLSFVLITHTCDVTSLAKNLDLYPYHVSKGGPLRNMNDLLSDSRAKKLWRKRMRYISDRWGHSRRIAMWELYNELLNCGGKDAEAAASWTAEMGKALRSYEKERYGKSHPVIVSTVDLVPDHEFFVTCPGTDIMVTHYYGDAHSSGNAVLSALDIHQGVTRNLRDVAYSRPYMENERTLSISFPKRTQKEMEHNAAWALMASGAANPGCTWVRMGVWNAFRTKDLVSDTHKAMSRIIDTIDFSSFDSRPMNVRSSNPEVKVMAVGDGATVLGWVLHNNPNDYDIENIHAWQSGRISQPKLIPMLVINWLRIVREGAPEGIARDVESKFAQMLSAQLGLTENEGHRFATQFLDEPVKFHSTVKEIARLKRRKPDLQKAREAILEVAKKLEAVEKEHGVLRKSYRNHPEVRSKLTINDMDPGEREVTWYDDNTGEVVRRELVSGKSFMIETPAFRKHIAFVIR